MQISKINISLPLDIFARSFALLHPFFRFCKTPIRFRFFFSLCYNNNRVDDVTWQHKNYTLFNPQWMIENRYSQATEVGWADESRARVGGGNLFKLQSGCILKSGVIEKVDVDGLVRRHLEKLKLNLRRWKCLEKLKKIINISSKLKEV